MSAWADCTRSGVRVTCDFGTTLQFGGDAPITLSHDGTLLHGLYLKAADQADGDVWAVVQTFRPDTPASFQALLVKRNDRSVTAIGYVQGTSAVWVTESGLVCYVHVGGRTWQCGEEVKPVPDVIIGTSQGFAWVTNDGIAAFNIPGFGPVFKGQQFLAHRQSGEWSVGVAPGDADVNAYVYRHSTDELFSAFNERRPVPPLISEQADGSAVVSLQQPGAFVHSSQFAPVVPVPPTPEPPEPEPPPPTPEPPTMPESLLPLIEAERAKYGAGLTNDECVALLEAVASQSPGWGLLHKPNGNNGRRRDGTLCSVDHLVYAPTLKGLDVLSDAGAGGPSTPQWNGNADEWEQFPVDRFVAPLTSHPDPEPGPTPEPPPTPDPPAPVPAPCDLAPVLAKLDLLNQNDADLVSMILELHSEVLRLRELVSNRPFPNYTGRVAFQNVTLRPSE